MPIEIRNFIQKTWKTGYVYLPLFFPLNAISLDIIHKINILTFSKVERIGSLATYLRIQALAWWWIPWILILFMYSRFWADEASPPKCQQVGRGKKIPNQVNRKGGPRKKEKFYKIMLYSNQRENSVALITTHSRKGQVES